MRGLLGFPEHESSQYRGHWGSACSVTFSLTRQRRVDRHNVSLEFDRSYKDRSNLRIERDRQRERKRERENPENLIGN